MEFRCLSYLNKFSDWTRCTKEREQPWQSNCRLLITVSKRTEKNQASETYLLRDAQRPCLAYRSALTPFSLEFFCLVFGHTVQPCHFLRVEEWRGEGGCGGWALFAHAIVLYFWTMGCFYPWQFYRCGNCNKWLSWYHSKVLKFWVMTMKQRAVDRFPWSHVNLGSLCMASPSTQSSVWGPAASVPAAAVRSAHPEMGEGSWLWPTATSRKYRLGTCPMHCNDCSSLCWAGAALRLVGMSIQEKGCCNWLLHFFQLH